MRIKRHRLLIAGVMVGALLPLVAVGTASAATTSGHHTTGHNSSPNINPTWKEYRVVGKTNKGYVNGDWTFCGHGVNSTNITPVNFSCSRTVTSSTTIQVSATYTADKISTAFGFQISHTYTYSTSLGLVVPLPAHKQADIDFGTYYAKIYGGMEVRTCSPQFCLPWSGPTYFTEQQALAPDIGAFNERAYP